MYYLPYIGAFLVLLLALLIGAYELTELYSKEDLPKIVGAALGASVGGIVAILLFFLARAKDQEAKAQDTVKLMRGHWQDIWTMLPSVYDEMVYWVSRSGDDDDEPTKRHRPEAHELVVEHLRSTFYDANLRLFHRLDLKSQRLILDFHDNLRIVCEQISRVLAMVIERDRRSTESQPADLQSRNTAAINLLERDIEALTDSIAGLLENVVLHGWAAQEHLDADRKWQKEYEDVTRGDGNYLPSYKLDWIGGVKSLIEKYKERPHSRDDGH